ncbi:MAG: glycosyltransferase family 4 protein [Candidatus Korobacteraceae bacterium]
MTELASALGSRGWRVLVVCAQPSLSLRATAGHVPYRMEYKGTRIHRVPAWGAHRSGLVWRMVFAFTYTLLSALAAVWYRREYDVIVLTTNPPILGFATRFVSFLVRRPYVHIIYDVYPETLAALEVLSPNSFAFWVWQRLFRGVLLGAAANIVIGRDMEEVIRTKCGGRPCQIRLIPNWSDGQVVFPLNGHPNRFRAQHVPAGALLVQYSGRIGRIHNVEPLIDAAEILHDTKVLFQFIGDGARLQALQESVRQRGLQNVQFLDYQPISDLAETLSAADIAVVCLASSSTSLSVPSKAYGIMAAGRPILGLMERCSEIGRVIEENGCGVVLEDADGPKVAETITTLLKDRKALNRMGQNGYKAFKENYTLVRAARSYDLLLRKIRNRSVAGVAVEVESERGGA